MEENKLNYEGLSELMNKIDEAMRMSNQKLADINKKNEELLEETRTLIVEKGQEEIKQMELNKQEFDEMTVNSLVFAMQQLYEIRESSEKEYQEMLMQTAQRNRKIDEILKSKKIEFASNYISEEELSRVETNAEKAKQKLNAEMQEFEKEHFEKIAKLNEWEESIKNYAIDLNVENKIAEVAKSVEQSEEEQSEVKKSEQDKPEQDKPEQEKLEQDRPEQDRPEQEQSGHDKTELKQPGQNKPEPKQPGQNKPVKKQPGQNKPEPKQPGQNKPVKKQPESKLSEAKIKKVEFYLDSKGRIAYQAEIETSKGNYSYEWLELEDCASKMDAKQARELRENAITRPKKYYDVNLANLLQQVDEKYGTNGITQYDTMMQTKNRNDIIETDFNISYDLSNIYDTYPKEENALKYIKKIAQANSKKGLASYIKQPNWLARLWKQIVSPKLGPVDEPHETTEADKEEAFEIMAREPEFDIKEFQKAYDLSDEDMKPWNEKYANIQEEKNRRENTLFRKRLVVEAKKGPESEKEQKGETESELKDKPVEISEGREPGDE